MSQEVVGLTLFLTISNLVSAVAHFRLRDFWLATGLSVFASVFGFHLAVLMIERRLDAFVVVSILTTAAASFMIALVWGLLMRKMRPL